MNNPFLLSSINRLEYWKKFRKNISDFSDEQKICEVVKYWSNAPLLNIAYNYDEPSTWPTIWEMIEKNDWCRNSIAIGMDSTLRLCGFNESRLTLGTIIDYNNSIMQMVVKIDNSYILNYDWNTITVYSSVKCRWLKKFKWSMKHYVEVYD